MFLCAEKLIKKMCDSPPLDTGILHVPVGTVESKTLTTVLFLLVYIAFEDVLQDLKPVLLHTDVFQNQLKHLLRRRSLELIS